MKILDKVLQSKGMTKEDLKEFNETSLSKLHDPEKILNLKELAEALNQIIVSRNKIRVVGDYDVDGVISTYILVKSLTKAGANVSYRLPDRRIDGYGINIDIINEAYNDGVEYIITCDNGIAAHSALNRALELGIKVFVTDHHNPQELLVPAELIVNPKHPSSTYPFRGICGATVVYKLMQYMGLEESDYLELITLATICDVCDLVDENRVIVKNGLLKISHPRNLGLNILAEKLEVLGKDMSTYHVGYIIGPHINAAGRLETAELPLRLLLSEDREEIENIVNQLIVLNSDRQRLTEIGLISARKQLITGDKVNVLNVLGSDEGVIGIIANKIAEETKKPTIIFTECDGGLLKGSGRSVDCYDMFKQLSLIRPLMKSFGGHSGAAGMTILKDDFKSFKKILNHYAQWINFEKFKVSEAIPLDLSEIDVPSIEEVDRQLAPYGQANKTPSYISYNVEAILAKKVGKTGSVLHLTVKDNSNKRMKAVSFKGLNQFEKTIVSRYSETDLARLYEGTSKNVYLDIEYYLEINEYKNNKYPQIKLKLIK